MKSQRIKPSIMKFIQKDNCTDRLIPINPKKVGLPGCNYRNRRNIVIQAVKQADGKDRQRVPESWKI